jgi:ornithine cyclodeaminase/alanine dehydrogenase-like protein (mu-crystallin family)
MVRTKETLILSRQEVAGCISFNEIREVVEETLKEHAKGNVMFPPRSVLPTKENKQAWPGYNSGLSARPAYLRLQDVAGV